MFYICCDWSKRSNLSREVTSVGYGLLKRFTVLKKVCPTHDIQMNGFAAVIFDLNISTFLHPDERFHQLTASEIEIYLSTILVMAKVLRYYLNLLPRIV